MGVFVNKLIIEDINGKEWVLHETFKWQSNDGYTITILPGFSTDFATVPKLLQLIFPPTDKYDKACLIHDFLYTGNNINRKRCDDYFLEALKDCEVTFLKRYIMYFSVRLFGRYYFNK